MQTAEQRKIYAFGESSDMINFGPHSQLTADTDYWGGYYTKRAEDVLSGKWASGDTWGGMKDGMVVMAPYSNMPDDVKKMAMATEKNPSSLESYIPSNALLSIKTTKLSIVKAAIISMTVRSSA